MNGELLGERFALLREVGSGGVSTVYLGRDEVLDRPVAVKVLKAGFEDSHAGRHFRREARAAARLSHPNVAQVYDVGEDVLSGRKVSYIVMEYLPGGDLEKLIKVRGRLTEVMLSRIGADIASGLFHAHAHNVIHRDVKPQNILMDAHGNPKLTDFGLARAGYRAGAYSSPEQLRGERVTPKSDVYSLGATLYEAATGTPPFVDGPAEVVDQEPPTAIIPPRRRGAAIGESHEAAIMSCLSRNPDARPDAAGLRAMLLGRDEEETAPSAGTRTSVTLKTLGTAGAAGISWAARTAREAGTAGAGYLGGAVRNATERRQTENGSRSVETVFVQGGSFARLDRRAVILAAAALVLLLILVWVAISVLGSGETNNTAGESARKDPAEKAAGSGGDAGGETTVEKTVPEETAPAPPVDTADDVVFEMYVAATENDYEGSWNRLSSRYQEEEIGSLEEWEQRQSSLTGLTVTQEFVAQSAGEGKAKVTFQTEETRDGVTMSVSGVWTTVNEDGEWKLDRFVER